MSTTVVRITDLLHLQNQWVVALYVFLATIALLVLKSWYDGRKLDRLLEEENKVGRCTPATLLCVAFCGDVTQQCNKQIVASL